MSEKSEKQSLYLSKIRKIIRDKYSLEEAAVKLNSSFSEDFKMDEIDFIEFVLELEEEFNIDLTDENAEKMKSVKDLIDLLMVPV